MTAPTSAARTIAVHIDPVVFELAPRYRRTVLTCTAGEDATGGQAAIQAALKIAAASWLGRNVAAHRTVEQWHTAFKCFGISTRKYRPSPEALLRRASRGHDVTNGNPLVDLGCAVTLATCLPVGVHAVENWMHSLALGPATGAEVFTTLARESEHPEPGELVYSSGTTVLARRWVWRQGWHGSITGSGPWQLAINIDSLGEDASVEAVEMTQMLLTNWGATAIRIAALTIDSPSADLTW